MTPEQLREIWQEELVTVHTEQLAKFPFQEITKEFLSGGMILEYGELSFDNLTKELQTVNTYWKLDDEYFDDFITIGFNGSGDPVAIDLKNKDQVLYFNHDNYFEEIFINQNIERLVETIIRVDRFNWNKKKYAKNSNYLTEFSDEEFDNLKSDLKFIDSQIFENKSFWEDTIEYYLWEREYERKKVDNH